MLPNLKWLEQNQPDSFFDQSLCTQWLEITIPFTTVGGVQRTIHCVERLCDGLNASIRIVRTVQVPYPLDLDTPSIARSALAAELNVLESTLPVSVDIWLCRESKEALLSAIPQSALVFMAYRRRILATPEERVARTLRAAGYQVSMLLEEKLHA